MQAKVILVVAIVLGAFSPAVAATSTFDMTGARAFCISGDSAKADGCISAQRRDGAWLDAWAASGEYPRFMAKRVIRRCAARYSPDLRRVRNCVDYVRDDRGNSRRRR